MATTGEVGVAVRLSTEPLSTSSKTGLFESYKRRRQDAGNVLLSQYGTYGGIQRPPRPQDDLRASRKEEEYKTALNASAAPMAGIDTSVVDPSLVAQLAALNQQLELQRERLNDTGLKDPNQKQVSCKAFTFNGARRREKADITQDES